MLNVFTLCYPMGERCRVLCEGFYISRRALGCDFGTLTCINLCVQDTLPTRAMATWWQTHVLIRPKDQNFSRLVTQQKITDGWTVGPQPVEPEKAHRSRVEKYL